jgi:ABC-2 type transport system permease protein
MNLSKLILIFKREYLTRIRTKAFIITTLLAPLFIFAVTLLPILISSFGGEDQKIIAVSDPSGDLFTQLMVIDGDTYVPRHSTPVDTLKQLVTENEYDGLIIVSENNIQEPEFFYSSGGLELVSDVRRDLDRAFVQVKLKEKNLGDEVSGLLQARTNLQASRLSKEGETEDDGLSSFIIAYILAFSIYMALFIYGSVIMRGVLEEKTNRIVEIVISSVKPVELMIGKVLGVGFVGLTQFVVWALIFSSIAFFSAPLIAFFTSTGASSATAAASSSVTIPTIEFSVWIYFILYYLVGYLMYAALFAAIGSAVDSETETQQLMSPVIVFMIIPMILLGKVASDPMAPISVITSYIPLFSPVLMMTRIMVADIPFWEIALSFLLMIATAALFIWVGAKIYRVGILMYGKKASFKEIIKWMRY